ncbi:heavy-metal-associated domain-containing protein [Sedimentibacter sp.]|uniref:heavy-metal-associated domain-containing protein n=1 Tax=Sedimentibacter sp. TaxID=1960295 RepID=UPI000EE87609|nr:heavy-metal-associated domain-containing protein [Sedimentibacter sp.]HCX62292.1 heavy metal-binding protein [Clostridiales bacterium]
MKKLTLQLEELGCPSCVKKIETALKKQDGVNEVNVLFNSSKAKIEYDEEKIDPDNISKAVTNLGYEVLSRK